VRVKICGITNLKDALIAIEAGADALGFVFYEKSPRYITPQRALEIVQKLPPFVERVGLFVNASQEEIQKIMAKTQMSLAQLHFDIDEAFLDSLGVKALPVVRVREPKDLQKFAHRYRLVDAFVPQFGGAGKRIALEWFKEMDCSKTILAGGLRVENIDEVKAFGFYGVDVSSGVEIAPGKKDPDKVRAFIQKAKSEQT